MADDRKKPIPVTSDDVTGAFGKLGRKIFGGGAAGSAADELKGRQKKLDDEIEKATNGYKNGGMVKVGKASTPYRCK